MFIDLRSTKAYLVENGIIVTEFPLSTSISKVLETYGSHIYSGSNVDSTDTPNADTMLQISTQGVNILIQPITDTRYITLSKNSTFYDIQNQLNESIALL